jgi:methyl-accepting chemotaxis protein
MNFFRNISIRSALVTALVLIELIVFGISIDNWMNSLSWYRQTQRIHDITATKAIALEKTFAYMIRARLGAAVYSFAADQAQPDQQDLMLKVIPAHLKNVEKYLAIFDSIKIPDTEGQQLSDQLVQQFHNYLDNFVKPSHEAVLSKDMVKMKQVQLASTQGALGLNEALGKFNNYSDNMTTQLLTAADASLKRSQIITGAILFAALILGWLLHIGFTRAVINPLNQIVLHFKRIARGDLSTHIEQEGKSEIHVVLQALSQMQSSLSELVDNVRKSSHGIESELLGIADGNQNLSQRTEMQASNLEETAASMEQLSSTVKTNAENAGLANKMAAETSSIASMGGDKMQAVVTTMEDIAESSRKISDIIGVIDGIAFQTNILALNAAVEAARAGEQGRGFAVVASEVRSLASRSAEAAKEIKVLINASVEKVDVGTKQVYDAGVSMQEIVTQVKKVSQLIHDISTATAEQSSGIGQIGIAVNQLDEMTQQNAGLVEKSAASVQSLKEQVAILTEIVSVFKLSDRRGTHDFDTVQAPPQLSKQRRPDILIESNS